MFLLYSLHRVGSANVSTALLMIRRDLIVIDICIACSFDKFVLITVHLIEVFSELENVKRHSNGFIKDFCIFVSFIYDLYYLQSIVKTQFKGYRIVILFFPKAAQIWIELEEIPLINFDLILHFINSLVNDLVCVVNYKSKGKFVNEIDY